MVDDREREDGSMQTDPFIGVLSDWDYIVKDDVHMGDGRVDVVDEGVGNLPAVLIQAPME